MLYGSFRADSSIFLVCLHDLRWYSIIAHVARWEPCILHDLVLLRGAIVNRTYGIYKNLYISPFLLTIFGPINYGPP